MAELGRKGTTGSNQEVLKALQLESQLASFCCPQSGTERDQELRLNIYVLENSVVGALLTLLEAALPSRQNHDGNG